MLPWCDSQPLAHSDCIYVDRLELLLVTEQFGLMQADVMVFGSFALQEGQ